MGLMDFNSNGFDADEARYDRMNRTSPSEFPPGQGDDMNSIFNNDISQPVGGGGSIFDNSFQSGAGGMGMGMGMQGLQPMQNTQPQKKSAEDMLFDGAVKGLKETGGFLSEVFNSFKSITARFWQIWGYRSMITSIIVFVVGLLLRLFGIRFGMQLAIGGLVGAIPSVVTFLFMTESARLCSGLYKDEEQVDIPKQSNDSFNSFGEGGDIFGGMTDDTDTDFDYDEDDSDFSFDSDEDDFDFEEEEPCEGVSTEDALSTMQVIDKGMYTRQYLYDMMTKVLPTITPSYYNEKEYTEDDDIFLYWEEQLRDAAQVSGCKEDYLPELRSLSENLFTIKIVCDRPTGFKPDIVAQELARIYAHMENIEGVTSKAEPVGSECYITIFTGKSAMISLKDMYNQVEDFMLDSKNYIPIVLGVDTSGKVLKFDFKKLESVIITGMPRSGKSWFVQAVLFQMCSFVSPKEMQIYICDPKEGISDFKAFTLPHVKKFVSEDSKILSTLRNLVKVEAPRRKKIIGDAGFVNIWDYKEVYPDVHLPIIYVVVDEIVTLASRMDKDTNNEFRMLLRELISQLPALGIRAFLIPHVLNNDIIEKKTSDLVKCRISVCGDADHIEKATGSKPKDFPYKLVNKGDMAVRMSDLSANTMFIHAPAITASNPKNNEIFDYARRVWGMLEPDEVKDSVAFNAESEREQNELLKNLQISDDDLDLFG